MTKAVKQNILIALVLAIMAVATVDLLAPFGLATTPDSYSYLDMAANISQGHGAVMRNLSLDAYITGENLFREQRLWPKLYSYLLSFFVDVSFAFSAVNILSAALLFLSSFIIFLFFNRFVYAHLAILPALVFIYLQPVMTIYAFVWSETLFLPLYLALAFSVIAYFLDDRSAWSPWSVVICLCLIGLAHTRYIGIGLALLAPFLLIKRTTKLQLLVWLVMALLYISSVGGMLYKNYMLTGSLSGGYRPESNKTIAENLYDGYLAFTAVMPSVSIFLGLMVLAGLFLYVLREKFAQVQQRALKYSLIVCAILMLSYCLLLFSLRMQSSFDAIDVRLLTPALVSLWLIAAMLSIFSFAYIKVSHIAKVGFVICFAFVLAMSVQGYKARQQHLDALNKEGKADFLLDATSSYASMTISEKILPLKTVSSQNLPKNAIVITNLSAEAVSLGLGFRTVQSPLIIDAASIGQMNRLPAGSVFIFLDGDNPFEEIAAQFDLIIPRAMLRMNGHVVLPLPITLEPKVANK